MREQIPLRVLAAHAQQSLALREVLDALRHHAHAKGLAECHNHPRHGCALRPTRDVIHEALVDLQNVDRELLQIPQRGILRPEVVDREAHTNLFQCVQHPQCRARVAHQHTFGDLERETIRCQSRPRERIAHLQQQRRMQQLTPRYVDADAKRTAIVASRPARGGVAGLVERPLTQFENRAAGFCNGNESRRADGPTLRMRPAQERFSADDAGRRELHDRLIHEAQFTALQREGDSSLEHQSFLRRRRTGRIEYGVPTLPLGLGAVHRSVRVSDQFRRRRCRFRECNANADAHARLARMLHIADLNRCAQCSRDALGHHVRVGGRRHVFKQDSEFITTKSGNGIRAARGIQQAAGYHPQQLVAGVVPE